MLIEGPMKIDIAEPADGQGKLLMVSFKPEFQAAEIAEQVKQFAAHLNKLAESINDETLDQRTRQGIMIVHQFSEQLLPHIESGDLALDETMIIQIRQEQQVSVLVDLLANPTPTS